MALITILYLSFHLGCNLIAQGVKKWCLKFSCTTFWDKMASNWGEPKQASWTIYYLCTLFCIYSYAGAEFVSRCGLSWAVLLLVPSSVIGREHYCIWCRTVWVQYHSSIYKQFIVHNLASSNASRFMESIWPLVTPLLRLGCYSPGPLSF